MTQKIDLERITSYCDAATPGPWENRRHSAGRNVANYVSSRSKQCVVGIPGETSERDAEFIANARTDLPLLVAEVERIRVELDECRRDLSTAQRQAACFHDEIGELREQVERLTPRWMDEPSDDGWYWIESNAIDKPQYLQRYGGDGEWGSCEGLAFFLFNGCKVAPCTGRPE